MWAHHWREQEMHLALLPFLHAPPSCEYRHIFFFHISLGSLLVTLCTNWESSKHIKRLVPNCHQSSSDFSTNRPLCYKKMWWENEVPASSPINWLATESPLGLPEFPHAHPLTEVCRDGLEGIILGAVRKEIHNGLGIQLSGSSLV